jgi:hypothetical protein
MNTYELAARRKKAAALLATLKEHGVTLEDAKVAEPEDWALAAKAASVKPPSAETVALVLAMMDPDHDVKQDAKWEESQEYGENRCPPRE